MTIQPIGTTAVALHYTCAELAPYGLSPAGLTLDQTLQLIRALCPPGALGAVDELELYPDGQGVLIFVHLRPGGPPRPCFHPPFRRGRVRRRPT